MRITRIATVELRLPVVLPIGDGTQDVLIVLVHTDEGLTGIGEVHTSPSVGAAIIHAPISHVRSRGLASVLVGEDPSDIEGCWKLMHEASEVYGRRGVALHAMRGIDLPIWDLRGKVEGRALCDLLGGRRHSELDTYASILMPDTVEETRMLANRCVDEGFGAIKYGWGGLGGSLARTAELVGTAREAGGDRDLMIDVGAGLNLPEAVALAEALTPFDIRFLEEPLHPDDLDGFAVLADATDIPIATGEKETSLAGFAQLLRHGRPDIVQPDLARTGGITETLRIWDLATAEGTELIPHCWSTDVLVSATAHFLASREPAIPLEFCLEDNPLRRDLAVEPLRNVDGRVQVPEGPGLGITLRRDTIEQFAVRWSHEPDETLAGAI
jgi:L-alanine-DL-glutamate epimerase-like enolase superfamily enzyme